MKLTFSSQEPTASQVGKFLNNMSIESQSMQPSQRERPPVPLFSQAPGSGPQPGAGTQQLSDGDGVECSQLIDYAPMATPDFITPADQFGLEYEPGNNDAKHQRSPAQLSPNRLKRARKGDEGAPDSAPR